MSSDLINKLLSDARRYGSRYQMYRDYYDGRHKAMITDRQREYLELDADQEFSANYCPIVVDNLANRLVLVGFDAPQGEELWKLWTAARVFKIESSTHVSTIRDGDGVVVVEWDSEENLPVVSFQLADGGRGGAQVYYSPDTGKPIYATKRWRTEDAGGDEIWRLNLYEPARISRWYAPATDILQADWKPWSSGVETVTDWTGEGGRPLGISAIHFTNRARGYTHGRSELSDAIPMQNALTKSVIDLIAAADASGFRLIWVVGDDADEIEVGPGVIANSLKSSQEADMKVYNGEDMRPLIEVVDSFVQRIGQVTGTPVTYFQQSGQVASEGTHQQHESLAITKARVVSVEIGESWRQVAVMVMTLANEFGGASYDLKQEIKPIWADFDTRTAGEKLLERIEALKGLVESGSSIKSAALVVGFSEAEATLLAKIDMSNDPLRAAALMQAQARPQPREEESDQQPV
jgi:hypothetical protein